MAIARPSVRYTCTSRPKNGTTGTFGRNLGQLADLLLLELRRAEPVGLRPYRLQSAMLIPQSNMSRLIDRVAKAGYVERRCCDEDERGQIIRITPDGKALQRKMWPIYRSALEREFALKLAQVDAERLARLLQPLTSAIPAMPFVVSVSGTRRTQ
jgi:DNA-binding MarR family transcriptional regulator